MAPTPDMLDPEQLLEHAAWLRRLAGHLVADPGAADDLVQDTWLAALRRPPSTDRPVRPWLRRVITNVARFRWRGDTHRAAREREAGELADPAVPSSAELLERHETQQLLARLVGELEEPYRGTVLLRYAEGLEPTEIARRLGIPPGTVRSRLAEALDRLRVRLDAHHRGDRRAWIAALGPLAWRDTAPAIPVIAIAFALACVVAIAAVWLASGSASKPAVPASRAPAVARSAPPAAAAARGFAWLAQAGARERHVAGRVVLDRQPVRDAEVRLVDDATRAGLAPVAVQHTASDGRFDFGTHDASEVIVAAAIPGKLATIEHVDLRDPTRASDALELAIEDCYAALYGRVTDASGTPIAHAKLLREDAIGTESDASGNYELCMRPFGNGWDTLRVYVHADAYGTVSLTKGLAGRTRHDFVLAPEATIAGRAVRHDGSPITGAQIRLESDDDWTRDVTHDAPRLFAASDGDGRFRIAGVAAGRYFVRGAAAGLAAEPIALLARPGDTREVELVLDPTRTIRGRVVEAGVAITGARVAIAHADEPAARSQTDGSFVLDRVPAGDVELVAGPMRVRAGGHVAANATGDVVLEVERLAAIAGTVRRGGASAPFARVCATTGRPPNACTFADAAGRYAIEGLEPGRWALFAADAHVAAIENDDQMFPLALGERRERDVELTDGARIAGTVTDAAGAPVAGAFVVFHDDHRWDDGRCVTDSGGRFECGSLAAGSFHATVHAAADSATPYPFSGAPPAPIALRDGNDHVEGVHLVIDATTFEIHGLAVDASGAPLPDVPITAAPDGGNAGWQPMSLAAVTDRDGRFALRGLPRGTYALEAEVLDGTRSIFRRVAAGTRDLRIVVDSALCAHPELAPAGDPIRAAIRHVEPPGIATRPRSPIVWNHQLELVGWALPAAIQIGKPFEATLVYRVLAPLPATWKVFVHFDGATHRAGLGDHDPIEGRCATSTWQPGDFIVDRFTSTIGPGSGETRVTVWTGLFRGGPPDWDNLPISDAPGELRDNHYPRVELAIVPLE